MEEQIVQWIHCDNKIKEYNQKCKSIKELKDKLSSDILQNIDIENKEKSNLPTFHVQSMNTIITPQISNSYENMTQKFYKECFTEFLQSEEKADELLTFMKQKRKIQKKFSLKRDILMDLNDS